MTKKISWTPALTLRSRHGAALCKAGKYREAEAELAEVIRRRSPSAGPGDLTLLHARRWHLHALARMGRLADAEDDLRFLAQAAAQEHGPDHPDVLGHRERHATSLWEAGRHEEAVTEMADVAARRAVALGDDHADTVRAAGSLAAMTSGDEDYHFGFETAGLRRPLVSQAQPHHQHGHTILVDCIGLHFKPDPPAAPCTTSSTPVPGHASVCYHFILSAHYKSLISIHKGQIYELNV
jgi:hypothetical protein